MEKKSDLPAKRQKMEDKDVIQKTDDTKVVKDFDKIQKVNDTISKIDDKIPKMDDTGAPAPSATSTTTDVTAAASSDVKTAQLIHFDSPPTPPPRQQISEDTIEPKRGESVIYPEEYSTFDVNKILFPSELIACKVGGGDMGFIYMKTTDGPKSIHIQSPVLMTPTGITQFSDGKFSMIGSLGKNYMECPSLVEFRNLTDRIEDRVARWLLEKDLASLDVRKKLNLEAIKERFSRMVTEGINKKTKETFSAALSMIVTIAETKSSKATKFFKPVINRKTGKKAYLPATAADISKGSKVIIIFEIPWIHRKPDKGSYSFSIHARAAQVLIVDGGNSDSLPDAAIIS